VSTVLNGKTATVSVPAGAVAGETSIMITLYAPSALPRTFQSVARRHLSVPAGATILGGIAVNAGVALAAPLSLSLTATQPASGTSIMIAGSSAAGSSFVDVDTTTYAGGAAVDAANTVYTGPTLAIGSTLYVFYSVPTASVATPPAISTTITGPASVTSGSTATYTASQEANSGGFPYLYAGTLVWSVDNSQLGTISNGVLTGGGVSNVSGHVIATDSKHASITGSLAVSLLAGRPANAGALLTYGGTVTRTVANIAVPSPPPNAIAAPEPVPSGTIATNTMSGTVTLTVASTPAPSASSTVVLNESETDSYALSTLQTTTQATIGYVPSGASTLVQLQNSSATDSNGVAYNTTYTATSGLLTSIPENGSNFGPNDASLTYTETDPGIVAASGTPYTTQRIQNSDGSYSETTYNDDGTEDLASSTASPITGTSYIESADGTVANTYLVYSFGAPVLSGRTTTIPATQTENGTLKATFSVDSWYGSPNAPLYFETDGTTASATLPAGCSGVPAAYAAGLTSTTESAESIDPALGNFEIDTSTTYDLPGVGTVCSVMNDVVKTYYDYTLQEGYSLYYGLRSPIITTTYAETVYLKSASVPGQPASTQAAARKATSVSTLSAGAVLVARERLHHQIRHDQLQRKIAAARLIRALLGGR